MKSAIIEDSVKLGYIHSEIYTDFGDANGRSCMAIWPANWHVCNKRTLKVLSSISRDNIGGSLGEVINMIGLFIKEGPVVQVKGPVGEPGCYRVKGKTALYDSPLVVLVNEMSASAAEALCCGYPGLSPGHHHRQQFYLWQGVRTTSLSALVTTA